MTNVDSIYFHFLTFLFDFFLALVEWNDRDVNEWQRHSVVILWVCLDLARILNLWWFCYRCRAAAVVVLLLHTNIALSYKIKNNNDTLLKQMCRFSYFKNWGNCCGKFYYIILHLKSTNAFHCKLLPFFHHFTTPTTIFENFWWQYERMDERNTHLKIF